jgi:hypothetical protein
MKKTKFEIIRPLDSININPEKDTYYILHDNFISSAENVTEEENKIAMKYLSLIHTSLEDNDEIVFSLQSINIYNLVIYDVILMVEN